MLPKLCQFTRVVTLMWIGHNTNVDECIENMKTKVDYVTK